jgi:hypothetical protein
MKKFIALALTGTTAAIGLAACGAGSNDTVTGTQAGSQFVACVKTYSQPTVAVVDQDFQLWIKGKASGRGGSACVPPKHALSSKAVTSARLVVDAYEPTVKQQEQQRQQQEQQKQQQQQEQQQQAALLAEQTLAKTSLESMILKDARQKVNDGVLDGPIKKVTCDAATSADSSSTEGTFNCLAVTQTNSDGTDSGYGYVGTANYDTGEISAHMGNN